MAHGDAVYSKNEGNYMAWAAGGNVDSGDTGLGRITQMIAPH